MLTNYNTNIFIMIEIIEPDKLHRYIWHLGPYIVYYTGDDKEYSPKMEENIKIMSKKYPKLTIFEIRWQDQKIVTPTTYTLLMNYIYLYSECFLRLKYYKPNDSEIVFVFIEAIKYHNMKIDKKVLNVGTRSRSNITLGRNILDEKDMKKLRLNDRKCLSKRKFILKDKIILPKSESSDILRNNKNYLLKETKNIDITKETSKINFINSSICRDVLKNSLFVSPNPWFCDIELGDLPSDLILIDGIFIIILDNSRKNSKNLSSNISSKVKI